MTAPAFEKVNIDIKIVGGRRLPLVDILKSILGMGLAKINKKYYE
jgi:hypothetical protein